MTLHFSHQHRLARPGLEQQQRLMRMRPAPLIIMPRCRRFRDDEEHAPLLGSRGAGISRAKRPRSVYARHADDEPQPSRRRLCAPTYGRAAISFSAIGVSVGFATDDAALREMLRCSAFSRHSMLAGRAQLYSSPDSLPSLASTDAAIGF